MKYIVTRKEIWDTTVEVEAASAEQARYRVAYGEGTELTNEYNRTLDVDTWTVEEAID